MDRVGPNLQHDTGIMHTLSKNVPKTNPPPDLVRLSGTLGKSLRV